MKLTFGVDEAGRGPVIGPMALAVVCLSPRQSAALLALGVQDSKTFGSTPESQEKRANLAHLIVRRATFARCLLVDASTIDAHVIERGLNVLERQLAANLLRQARAQDHHEIICDGARLFSPLKQNFPRLQAVDQGEAAHVAVAAASILAKHARDQAFANIAQKHYSDLGVPIRGGGYFNAATRALMDAYLCKHNCLPPETRQTWLRSEPLAQQPRS